MELRNLLANYEEHVSTLSSSDFGTETWDLIASSAYEAALSVYDNIKQNWGWQHEGTVPGELCVRVLKRHTRAFVSDGIASAPIRELTDRLAETEDSITTDIPTVRRMVRAFAQLAVLYLDADDPRLANAGALSLPFPGAPGNWTWSKTSSKSWRSEKNRRPRLWVARCWHSDGRTPSVA